MREYEERWVIEIAEMLEGAGYPNAVQRARRLVRAGYGPEEIAHRVRTDQIENLVSPDARIFGAEASERPALRWTDVAFNESKDVARFAKLIEKVSSEVTATADGHIVTTNATGRDIGRVLSRNTWEGGYRVGSNAGKFDLAAEAGAEGETGFERGWIRAIELWKGGMTWEMITHKADQESAHRSLEYARGMVASVEAMRGWLDLARREAKAHGIPSAVTDRLIERSQSAEEKTNRAEAPGRCRLEWTNEGDFLVAKGAKGLYRVLNVGDAFTLTVGSTYIGSFKFKEGAQASAERHEAADGAMAAENVPVATEHSAACSENCGHQPRAAEVSPLTWSRRKKLPHGNIERTAPGGYRVYSAGKAAKGRVWVASLNGALIGQYVTMDEAMKAANAQRIMSQPESDVAPPRVYPLPAPERVGSTKRVKVAPLAWHLSSSGRRATGAKGTYVIEHVKRPRGQGHKSWGLKLNDVIEIGYFARASLAKARAQKHDRGVIGERGAETARAAERAPVLHEELIHERAATVPMPAPGPEIALPWIRITRDAKSYEAIVEVAKKIGAIDGPPKVYEVLHGPMLREDQEVFVVLVLDLHSMLRGVCEVARGERSSVNVGIEDVMRAAIGCPGGRYFYIVHNHPSADSYASKSDRDLFKSVQEACKPFANLECLDHLVVGVCEIHSIGGNKTYKTKKKG